MSDRRSQGSGPEILICQFPLVINGLTAGELKPSVIKVDGQGRNQRCLREIRDPDRGLSPVLESPSSENRVSEDHCSFLREEGLCPRQIDQESKPPRN